MTTANASTEKPIHITRRPEMVSRSSATRPAGADFKTSGQWEASDDRVEDELVKLARQRAKGGDTIPWAELKSELGL